MRLLCPRKILQNGEQPLLPTAGCSFLPFQMRFNKVRRFPAWEPCAQHPCKWGMAGEIPEQPVLSCGTGPLGGTGHSPAVLTGHPEGPAEPPVPGFQDSRGKNTHRLHFSYVSKVSAKLQNS